MAMKSPLSRLLVVAEEPLFSGAALSLDGLIQSVQGNSHGAIVTFSGCVRDLEGGKKIDAIIYEAYQPMAEIELKKIVKEAEDRWNVRVAFQHRVGRVAIGEPSVVVACGGAHRKEAFDACEFVINQLKANVPIWKIQYEFA